MRRGMKITAAIAGVLAGASFAGVALGAALVLGVVAVLAMVPDAPSVAPVQVAVVQTAPAETRSEPEPALAPSAPIAASATPAVATPPATRRPTATRPKAMPAAPPDRSTGDLLADEEPWEALGFDSPPAPPASVGSEKDAVADDLDAVLSDFPRRR